jgi:hypothetical protein
MNNYIQQAVKLTNQKAHNINLDDEALYKFEITTNPSSENNIDNEFMSDIQSGKHLVETNLYKYLNK